MAVQRGGEGSQWPSEMGCGSGGDGGGDDDGDDDDDDDDDDETNEGSSFAGSHSCCTCTIANSSLSQYK